MLRYFLPLLLASVVSAQDKTAYVGELVTLSCVGEYPQLVWTFNGRVVASGSTAYNPNYNVNYDGVWSNLTFTANNSGNFVCEQGVGDRKRVAAYWLTVQQHPKRINATVNETVTLTCLSNPKPASWVYENMDVVQLDDRVWVNNTVEYQYDLIISNARFNDSNTYKCKKNSYRNNVVAAYIVAVAAVAPRTVAVPTRARTTPVKPSTVVPTRAMASTTTPSTTTPSTTTPTTTPSTTPLAVITTAMPMPVPPRLIIAVVCGGALLAVIGIGVALCCCRRRRKPLPAATDLEMQEFIETV